MANYTNEQLDSLLIGAQERYQTYRAEYLALIKLVEDLREARQDNATLENRIAELERGQAID